jgi:hypothetical protein
MSVFAKFVREIAENGIRTARTMYGNLDKGATDAQKKRIETAIEKFKDRPTTRKNAEPEGMARDPITGGNVRAASDVDKGKTGKVTRSPEPGFLQLQRTEGSRAMAQEKTDLSKKVREGTATAAEKKRLRDLRQKDIADTLSATAKGAQTRKTKTKAALPELKSIPTEKKTAPKPAINRRTGEINESVFNKLTPPQQEAQIRSAMAIMEGPRKRELKAMLDEIKPKKPGESGVGKRKGGNKGMSGAADKSQEVVGRGGTNFNRGGKVTKRATGAHDYRMNKGGLLLSSVDNRKKR